MDQTRYIEETAGAATEAAIAYVRALKASDAERLRRIIAAALANVAEQAKTLTAAPAAPTVEVCAHTINRADEPLLGPWRCPACGAKMDGSDYEFTGAPVFPAGRWLQFSDGWRHLCRGYGAPPAVAERVAEVTA